jgi:hypothetical protein
VFSLENHRIDIWSTGSPRPGSELPRELTFLDVLRINNNLFIVNETSPEQTTFTKSVSVQAQK